MCGSFAPHGRATITDDGVIVNGRWPYASGCTVADYFCGACVATDTTREQPRRTGRRTDRPASHRASRRLPHRGDMGRAGLTATGSHDVIVTNAHVPHDQILHIGAGPRVDAAVYRLPLPARLSLSKVGVATGIARHALDQFTAIATTKIPHLPTPASRIGRRPTRTRRSRSTTPQRPGLRPRNDPDGVERHPRRPTAHRP